MKNVRIHFNIYYAQFIKVNFLETKKITLLAILAAVYALGSFLPGFPFIGFPGSKIDLVRSFEMGYGFILGPILGPITAFLGAIVGKVLTGGGISLYFTPLAPLSAFTAASLSRYKVYKFKGWLISAFIMLVLLFLWFTTGVGQSIPFYSTLYVIALIIIIGFREKIAEYIKSEDKSKLSLGIALASFSSTITGQLLGNLIFISIAKPSPIFFMTILPVTVVERIIITILSTIIMTPVILILRNLTPDLFI
ncbi:MAG: hypothetical protein ACXABG_05015 [Promethearchaeota archaeon]